MTFSCSKKNIYIKHYDDFYCLNCFHSFRAENKLKSHEKVRKNKDFWGIVMPSEKNEILEFKQYMKSDKMPYIIYDDIESLIRKIDGWESNPENSSTTKIGEHIPCGYSMPTFWGFSHIEEKHTLYRGKDCIKKFCESLRENGKGIIDFEMKKMLLFTRKELESYEDAKYAIFAEQDSLKNSLEI